MEFDVILVSLPAFTQKSPSLGLASLATYLNEKNYKINCYDFGIRFYKNALPKFKIRNSLVEQLKLSLYPLWGASNWLGIDDIINPEVGQSLLKSLCPVCSELYRPIFDEFIEQRSLTKTILDSYAEQLTNLDSVAYAFSILIGNAIATLYIIKKIKEKKPDATIIVGGPDVSPYYRATFYSQLDEIDFTVYHSEGEIPLECILSYLNGEIPKQHIPGIYFKTKTEIKKTDPPNLLNLNELPIPDFELVDTGYKLRQLKTLDILLSKGCAYHCTFCNEPLIWGFYRPKNSRKIFEEIRYYVKNYGITQFELGDNTFTSSTTFLKALKTISNFGIEIKWSGNCKINELNKQKLIQYHNLGLTHCYFGIESGSQKIIQLMGKNDNIAQKSKLLKICHQNQIKSSLYFMVGFPGETSEDFQKTLDFINENKEYINDIMTSVFTLMAGTKIFNLDFLIPIQIGPKIINAYTYQTKDGVTHEERKNRFLFIQKLWNQIKKLKN